MSWVPFVSSPPGVVERMLRLADVGPSDIVFDLGCGDGRILIAAVESFRAKEAVGYEIRDDVYKNALEVVARSNLQERVKIINRDFFEADISEASVITLYLNSFTNGKLRPKLEKEALPGTRIISHDFSMSSWRPSLEDSFQDDHTSHTIYLYLAPEAFSLGKKDNRTDS